MDLGEMDMVMWSGLVWLRIGTREDSGSIKCCETNEWLHKWWPLE
jgi:hypothetical protein